MCSRAADPERAGRLLQQLALHARREAGINLPFSATTPYQNTIPSRQQPPFPGSQEMERRIKSLVRWNAMAMVVRANKIQEGIGGHISTFASAATLYEVAFNHFFQAPPNPATAMLSIFRDTPHPEFTRAPTSKAASPKRSWKTSGAS
jgi:pyruvate dehydrogenase E1 component